MSTALKRTIGIVIVFVAIGALAAPRVLPLFRKPVPRTAQAAGAPSRAAGATAAPVQVTAVTLKGVPLGETITATGSLRADEGVELQPETNGKVIAINFTEGASVRKGDLLVKLNDAEPRATLQRTTYRMELAELKERRLAKLLETSGVNQQEYDAGLSELSVLRAEVALVEAQLAKMEIRAPFDGVVGLRFVSEGAFVTPTTRVATLQRFDRLKIDFSIPEKYAFRIRIGSPITFAVDGGGNRYNGEIYAIDPRIDAGTRTVLIRAICPNPDKRLLPGAFANVHFTLSEVVDALLVPSTAVIPGLSEKNVFVVHDGKAVRRTVQIGIRTESNVQITDGLAVGEMVITSGIQQLRAGQAVKVNSADPSANPVKQITVEQNPGDDLSKRSTPAS